jgi:hypothetical protein
VWQFVHHLALLVAMLALGAAAFRGASTAAPSGLERLLATVGLAVAAAAAEALGLGLVGLGGTAVALVAAAAATYAATCAWVPSPSLSAAAELSGWFTGLRSSQQIVAIALAGACVAWLVWQLLNFAIGFDSALYHYPFVAGWIENGRPGSGLSLSWEIPYNAYPLTDEVIQTWGAAISRSWVPLILWNPAMVGLLAIASWVTLRNLLVPRAAAALATGVLVTVPVLVRQLNEPQTDLPAFAWLGCTAGLATAAGRRPALLPFAVLTAGLAIGTKPSTGPMVVAVLLVGAYLARDSLRPLARWLALALASAFVVGGLWYAQNIVEHGSPLWPFAPGPWGDPEPRFLALVDTTFLQRPLDTLDGRVGDYAERLAGALIVLPAVLVALVYAALSPRPLRRSLTITGLLAVVGCLVWSMAWSTGLPTSPELSYAAGFPLSALRYLLPAIGAATVAVAIVARAGGVPRFLAMAALAAALAWNLVTDADLGVPWTPPIWVLLLGAAGGASLLGAIALARREPARPRRLPPAPIGAAVVAGALGVLLALAGDRIVERHTQMVGSTAYGRPLMSWFVDQPAFESGDGPIAVASRGVIAQLAGDHFDHRLVLVEQRTPCAELERVARRMPVVVTRPAFADGLLGVEDYSAYSCLSRHRPLVDRDPFFVYRLGGGALTRR